MGSSTSSAGKNIEQLRKEKAELKTKNEQLCKELEKEEDKLKTFGFTLEPVTKKYYLIGMKAQQNTAWGLKKGDIVLGFFLYGKDENSNPILDWFMAESYDRLLKRVQSGVRHEALFVDILDRGRFFLPMKQLELTRTEGETDCARA